MPGFFELGAIVGGTPVLPDNRRMDRCTGLRIPHQGGFTLVGNTDGRHITGAQPTLLERFAADFEGAQPQLFAVVLNPAILREVLLELLLSTGNGQALGTEDNRPAAGGALINGKQVMRHTRFPYCYGRRAGCSEAANGCKHGLGQLCQHSSVQLHLQPAPPGADINAGKLLRRLIDKGTQTLLLPQRADATEQVTGRALRCIGVSHIGFLHPGSLRQGFQIQRAGHRHHRHQQLAFLTGGQQRLEHLGRLKVELFRRFQAIGSRLGVVVITVHLVRSLGFFQQIDGRRHVRM